MIVTTTAPYTTEEIEKLQEQFGTYIKTVIDMKQKICSAGCDRHFDSEQILLQNGSRQADVWGGGVDLETKVIDYNSFINIRPMDNNQSNEIQDGTIRDTYKKFTEYFFHAVL